MNAKSDQDRLQTLHGGIDAARYLDILLAGATVGSSDFLGCIAAAFRTRKQASLTGNPFGALNARCNSPAVFISL